MAFWTYMLHCRDGYFYTGHTDDLEGGMAQCEAGVTKGFVTDHRPFKLMWSQEFGERHEALAAERQIKGGGRAKKMALIRGDWDEISRLARKKNSPPTSSARTAVGDRAGAGDTEN
ncbi:GIY-YIG nuclease family protein [Novosphingopyxis sp.]|uniref:GIY-YIG nuclease family protein n=1 Tax=Novosphingopyxis sp. TaxID=2709690 RepID=UPI003B5A7EC2